MSQESRFRQHRSIMAVEDLTGAGTGTGEELDLDSVQGDGAEAALLEMQEAATGAEQSEDAAAQMENSAIALESLIEVAESSLDAEGLDETSAKLLQTAVENELAPLAGAVPVEEVIPATEAFASPSGRREATIMALEAINERVKAIWAKVREYIQKVRDFFKKMWIAAKQMVQGLQRRVKALQSELGNRNFSMPKAGAVELKDGRWAVSAQQVKDLQALVEGVLVDYNKEAVKYANDVATNLSAGKPAEGAGKKKVSAPKLESLAGKELPGGRKLVSSDSGFQMHSVDGAGKPYSAKPLSEAELKGIVEALDKITSVVINYDKGFQEKDRAEEAVLKAGDKVSKEAKDGDAEAQAAARAAFNLTRDAANALNNPTRDLVRYAGAAISGIGAFVAANLKQYDKK